MLEVIQVEEVQLQELLAQYVLQDQAVMEDQHKLRVALEALLLLELRLVALIQLALQDRMFQ